MGQLVKSLTDEIFFQENGPTCEIDGCGLVYTHHFEPEYGRDTKESEGNCWCVFFRCRECGKEYLYFDTTGNYFIDDNGLHGPYIDEEELRMVSDKRFERQLRKSFRKGNEYSYPNSDFLILA
jgi:hypothetical protein